MRKIAGFRTADVLRREDGDEVAFVTLTRFGSIDDIRAFAGDDFEIPVIEPRAAELLSRYDERAMHYETSCFDAGSGERGQGTRHTHISAGREASP